MNIFFEWENPAYDTDYLDAITETAARLRNLVAKEQGLQYGKSPRYTNYAVYNTPLTEVYGENLPILKKLKRKYDPEGVMDLAGGWKF
jgi:FAD/FMN-containing dehydrogenase